MPTSAEFMLDLKPGKVSWRCEVNPRERFCYITHHVRPTYMETLFIGCDEDDKFALVIPFKHTAVTVPDFEYLSKSLARPEFAAEYLKVTKKIPGRYRRRVHSAAGVGCLYVMHTKIESATISEI